MTAPIRRRTRAREIAMQALFQFDLRGFDYATEIGSSVAEVCRAELLHAEREAADDKSKADGPKKVGKQNLAQVEAAGQLGSADQEILEFATRLVDGALEHREAIDQRLQSVTRNWDLRRMAVVDRNVLRLAVFELMFCDDVPPKVAINEAIDIGKKYSTANSGGFVNGILDRIRIDMERDRKAAKDAAASQADDSAAEVRPAEETGAADAEA